MRNKYSSAKMRLFCKDPSIPCRTFDGEMLLVRVKEIDPSVYREVSIPRTDFSARTAAERQKIALILDYIWSLSDEGILVRQGTYSIDDLIGQLY